MARAQYVTGDDPHSIGAFVTLISNPEDDIVVLDLLEEIEAAETKQEAEDTLAIIEQAWSTGYLAEAPVPSEVATGFLNALRREFVGKKRFAALKFLKSPHQTLTASQIENILNPYYVQLAGCLFFSEMFHSAPRFPFPSVIDALETHWTG